MKRYVSHLFEIGGEADGVIWQEASAGIVRITLFPSGMPECRARNGA